MKFFPPGQVSRIFNIRVKFSLFPIYSTGQFEEENVYYKNYLETWELFVIVIVCFLNILFLLVFS